MSKIAEQLSLTDIPAPPEFAPLPEQEISGEVLIEKYAKGKLASKKLDMIACNDVSRSDIGFASDDNAMTVFFKSNAEPAVLDKAPKTVIAKELVELIGKTINKKFTLVRP